LNWRHELDTWLTHTPDHVEIRSYEEITSGKASMQEYGLAVFDEAHYMKNPDAGRTKACLALKAVHRLFLTGTPVVNRPMDMFPILHSMGMKYTRQQFGKKFCAGYLKLVGWRPKKYAWDFTGSSNEEELGATLRRYVMVRRTKKEVLTELPKKIRTVIELDIPYEETPEVTAAATRYFNAMDTAAENIADTEKVLFTELASVRKEEALRKIPAILTFIYDLLEEEQKIVVFAYHREVLETLRSALNHKRVGNVLLYGGLGDVAKDTAVRVFQNDSDCKVFLGQLTAAGTGLTLTASRTVVFAEHDWVPGNLTQCEDRCHRMGQKDTVRVIHLVPAGSIEARMIRVVTEKQKVIDAIVQ
jgi:SWI/SNF-related matrix-associated actin-dependent regulator 1 of chromatin subfamily A